MKDVNVFKDNDRTKMEDEVKHEKKSNIPVTISALTEYYKRRYNTKDSIEHVYSDSEYDFSTIRKAIKTDSYARIMVDKFTSITLMRGWEYQSVLDKEEPIRYLEDRIGEMELVSNMIFKEYVEKLTRTLYGFSNSFMIKIRDKNATSGLPYKDPINKSRRDKIQPIARLDYADLIDYDMHVFSDEFANPTRYELYKDGSYLADFLPQDVVHIKIYPHRLWGMPILSQVIDDITMLRRLEEDMVLQYFQNGIPPIVLKVPPSPNQSPIGEDPNILYGKDMLENMLSHGGVVITQDCDLSVVSPNSLLDMTQGINHAKGRVLSGLHMSPLMIGESGGGKASTNALIDDFIMQAKYVQSVLASYLERYFINDLLRESKYMSVRKHVNKVKVFFPEIDIEYWSTILNQMMALFNANLVTRTEARKHWGALPMSKSDNSDTVSVIAPTKQMSTAQSEQKSAPANQHAKKMTTGKKSRVNDELLDLSPIVTQFLDNVDAVKYKEEVDLINNKYTLMHDDEIAYGAKCELQNDILDSILKITKEMAKTTISDEK